MARAHNPLMTPYLDRAAAAGGSLHRDLCSLLDAGFIESDGAVLFREMASRPTNARPDQFPDLTGYECFMNGISLDQRVSRDFVLQGLRLLDAFEMQWTKTFGQRPVVAILSGSGPSSTFRFHIRRPGEAWLTDDLESYGRAVVRLEL